MDRIARGTRDAFFLDLPLTPFGEALDLQRAAVAARFDGHLPADLVILVEHPPVGRFVPPETFDVWRDRARMMGFSEVASGPFVRSSYQARESFQRIHPMAP